MIKRKNLSRGILLSLCITSQITLNASLSTTREQDTESLQEAHGTGFSLVKKIMLSGLAISAVAVPLYLYFRKSAPNVTGGNNDSLSSHGTSRLSLPLSGKQTLGKDQPTSLSKILDNQSHFDAVYKGSQVDFDALARILPHYDNAHQLQIVGWASSVAPLVLAKEDLEKVRAKLYNLQRDHPLIVPTDELLSNANTTYAEFMEQSNKLNDAIGKIKRPEKGTDAEKNKNIEKNNKTKNPLDLAKEQLLNAYIKLIEKDPHHESLSSVEKLLNDDSAGRETLTQKATHLNEITSKVAPKGVQHKLTREEIENTIRAHNNFNRDDKPEAYSQFCLSHDNPQDKRSEHTKDITRVMKFGTAAHGATDTPQYDQLFKNAQAICNRLIVKWPLPQKLGTLV